MSDFFSDLFRASSHSLVLPREDEDAINRYVARQATNVQTNVESRPFPRQVDFWAFCIVTALALKVKPREGTISNWGKSFIYTNQGIIDNDLASLLAIVAVASIGLEDTKVTETRRIIEVANRLAAAGCPKVLSELQNSPLRTTPLDQTLEFARTLQGQVYGDS